MEDSVLSQEEINALLRGVAADGETETAAPGKEQPDEVAFQPGKVPETHRVIFNTIEPRTVIRNDAKITELSHVTFNLKIQLGETTLTVGELLNLKEESVIVLDKVVGENAKLLVNGRDLAEGEIVVLNDCFAFRLNLVDEGKKILPAMAQAEGESPE